METKFEFSNEYLVIKADENFLYFKQVNGNLKIKLSLEVILTVVKCLIKKVQEAAQTG